MKNATALQLYLHFRSYIPFFQPLVRRFPYPYARNLIALSIVLCMLHKNAKLDTITVRIYGVDIMKGFERKNQLLSLCGLNCGLCPMLLGNYCGGCGNGNQSCKIAKCSLEHERIEYCYECIQYPCEKYQHFDEYDSFITHRRQKADLEKNCPHYHLRNSLRMRQRYFKGLPMKKT